MPALPETPPALPIRTFMFMCRSWAPCPRALTARGTSAPVCRLDRLATRGGAGISDSGLGTGRRPAGDRSARRPGSTRTGSRRAASRAQRGRRLSRPARCRRGPAAFPSSNRATDPPVARQGGPGAPELRVHRHRASFLRTAARRCVAAKRHSMRLSQQRVRFLGARHATAAPQAVSAAVGGRFAQRRTRVRGLQMDVFSDDRRHPSLTNAGGRCRSTRRPAPLLIVSVGPLADPCRR